MWFRVRVIEDGVSVTVMKRVSVEVGVRVIIIALSCPGVQSESRKFQRESTCNKS